MDNLGTMGATSPGAYSDLSDRALLARFAAYFYGAGATLVLVTLAAPRASGAVIPGLVAPPLLAYALVLLLLTRGGRLPMWFFRCIPALGTALVTVVAWAARDAGAAYSLLYVWAALYAAYFLPPRDVAAQMGLIAAAVTVVIRFRGTETLPQTQWLMTFGTVVVGALWVRELVRQLRRHATGLTSLAQTSAVLRSDPEESRRDLCAACAEATGADAVLLLEDVGGRWQVTAATSAALLAAIPSHPRPAFDAGVARLVVALGEGGPIEQAIAGAGGLVSGFWQPVARESQVAAALLLGWSRRRRSVEEHTQALAALIAAQASAILERVDLLDRLGRLALTDSLTGLPNRRAFEQTVAEPTARDFAILAMDVDNLKPVNDQFGHEAGDAVLRQIGEVLSQVLRGWDIIARVGGDEFAALLAGASPEQAVAVAQRVRHALHGVSVPNGMARVSVGCAAGNAGDDATEVWRSADVALYQAKREGRDRVHLVRPGDPRQLLVEWGDLLPRLIEQRALRAVYQPIVNLADGEVLGFEALARPLGVAAGGSAEEMFTWAQRLGHVRDLDWICRRAALEGAQAMAPQASLFINVSVGALLDPVHGVDQLLLLLQSVHRDPETLVLELTEREIMADMRRLRQVVAAYREHGVRFALDDVGEGHSTLEVLAAVRPEFLKLAMSLVQSGTDPGALGAIEAAVSFARSTGATVVAEGIETAATVRRMMELGVSSGQGRLFGVPAESDGLPGVIVMGLGRHDPSRPVESGDATRTPSETDG